MSKGTAQEIEMCGRILHIGDYVRVRYTKGTWSNVCGTIEGKIVELWSPEQDNFLQARVDNGWCFHDYDEIIIHNVSKKT